MPIKVKYFASLKESLAKSEEQVSIDEPMTAIQVWRIANPSIQFPDNILVAINMDYAEPGDLVKDGDELAFFPPVTGG